MDRTLRERCIAYVRSRCAAGETRARIARELGLSEMTVHRWARRRPTVSTTASLVPVRILEARPTTAFVVTTPRGLRIDALDLDAVCTLVARLG